MGKYILSYYTSSPHSSTITPKSGCALNVLNQKISSVFSNSFYLVETTIEFTAGAGNLAGLILNFSSTDKIDEVRLYPHDALMQTFSYDKKGSLLLSSCDPSGTPIRYEYDGFDRVIGFMNMDNHYVQTNEYFYSNSSFNYNTIITRTVLASNKTSISAVQSLTGANVIREFNYFDGLGRPVQKVILDHAPSSSPTSASDVIVWIPYDAFGRQPAEMLPYSYAATNTTYNTVFRTGSSAEQTTFYGAIYPGEGGYAKIESILEASPLGRSLGVKQPGQNFSTHPASIDYQTNSANEVRNFYVGNLFYPANSLFKQAVTDGNGHTTLIYTDKLGRKIMEEVEGSKTYYLYNNAGMVVQIIQPEGSNAGHSTPSLHLNSPAILRHSFLYTYDAEYRLATYSAPGTTGNVSYLYDRLDRLVLETDQNGFKTFYKYDKLDRIIMTGRYTGSATPNSSQLLYENRSASEHYYTLNLSFPTSLCQVYSVMYYDDYNFNNDTGYNDDLSYQALPSSGMQYPSNFSTNHPSNLLHQLVRGKETGKKYGIINEDQSAPIIFVEQYAFYDKFGRPIQTKTIHPFGGADIEWIKYHFAGWELNRSREHTATLEGVYKQLFLSYR
ncbi:MAG TPA: DUF6443 domain-containing protein, partial [Saprospiraceae bacterium]|nr:DUF6443 domain-containing protein [Saprospiraceae bacterium]HMQ85894.1 DUF6443 domain-containing protein [Saprospiraceae bacterium]